MSQEQPATERRMPPGSPAGRLDLAVYRGDKGEMWIGIIFGLLAVPLFLAVLIKYPGNLAGYVVTPLVLTALGMLGWLTTVLTAVRVRADGLVVDNLLLRHVIPWERFAGLFVEPGRGMLTRVDDGKEIGCAAYGRSLGSALTGYKDMRADLDQIREDCRQAKTAHARADPAPPYRMRVNVPWRPLLGFLAFFETVSWVIFAVHAG